MAVCEWRRDADGFEYLVTDYRDATPEERYAVFREGTRAADAVERRVGLLVLGGEDGLDPMWFKEVKDRNSHDRQDRIRIALVGLGRRGGAVAAVLNVRLSHERARNFDDEADALTWLRETA